MERKRLELLRKDLMLELGIIEIERSVEGGFAKASASVTAREEKSRRASKSANGDSFQPPRIRGRTEQKKLDLTQPRRFVFDFRPP